MSSILGSTRTAVQANSMNRPTPLQKGKGAKELQQKIWKEITDALVKENPEVKQLAAL